MIKNHENTATEGVGAQFKQCSGCKQLLFASAFQRNARAKDGLQGYCKACAKDYQRAYVLERFGRVQVERNVYHGGGSKRCPGCNQILEVEKFGKRTKDKYGLDAYCKACNNNKRKQFRLAHRESFNAKNRQRARNQYLSDPKAYLAKHAAKRKRFKERHGISLNQRRKELEPEKYSARKKLRRAVADGKLAKPTSCQMCGVACNPHGHHYDYAIPLDVIWVCQTCHSRLHGKVPYK